MTVVHTSYGPGQVIGEEVVRGRKSLHIEGQNFRIWVDEANVRMGATTEPTLNVNKDNSVALPYNPSTQFPVEMFNTESTIQPNHEIDADERLRSSDSLTFKKAPERPSPGPSPDLFAKSAAGGAKTPHIVDIAGPSATGPGLTTQIGPEVDNDQGKGVKIQSGYADDHPEEFPYERLQPGEDPFADRPHDYPRPHPDPSQTDQGQEIEPLYKGDHHEIAHAAGLSNRYVQIEADIDHFNPIQQFRDDPVAFITRHAYLNSDDHVDIRLAEYMELIQYDPQTRAAARKDVHDKAYRLRREGRVHVKDIAPNRIYATVEGDSGVYETMITKDANWSCSCDWGKLAFQRAAGLCSHGWAAWLEMTAASVDDFKKWVKDDNDGRTDNPGLTNYIGQQDDLANDDDRVTKEDAEKLYDYVDGNESEPFEREYDIDYTNDPNDVYKQADALRLRPDSLTPDFLFAEDPEEPQQGIDVEKDERKTTGPDQIVHFSKRMDAEERNYIYGWQRFADDRDPTPPSSGDGLGHAQPHWLQEFNSVFPGADQPDPTGPPAAAGGVPDTHSTHPTIGVNGPETARAEAPPPSATGSSDPQAFGSGAAPHVPGAPTAPTAPTTPTAPGNAPPGGGGGNGWTARDVGTIGPGDYKVQEGDTEGNIAKGMGVTTDELTKANPGDIGHGDNMTTNNNLIHPGDTFHHPGEAAPAGDKGPEAGNQPGSPGEPPGSPPAAGSPPASPAPWAQPSPEVLATVPGAAVPGAADPATLATAEAAHPAANAGGLPGLPSPGSGGGDGTPSAATGSTTGAPAPKLSARQWFAAYMHTADPNQGGGWAGPTPPSPTWGKGQDPQGQPNVQSGDNSGVQPGFGPPVSDLDRGGTTGPILPVGRRQADILFRYADGAPQQEIPEYRDFDGGGPLLDKLRGLIEDCPTDDLQHMDTRNGEIRDVVEDLRDKGFDADNIVASFIRQAGASFILQAGEFPDSDAVQWPDEPFEGSGPAPKSWHGSSDEYVDEHERDHHVDDWHDSDGDILKYDMPKKQKESHYDPVEAFYKSGAAEAINFGTSSGGGFSDDAIAVQAMAFMKTAGRNYSFAEQRELEDEEHHLGARNLDGLDLRNTHYEDL